MDCAVFAVCRRPMSREVSGGPKRESQCADRAGVGKRLFEQLFSADSFACVKKDRCIDTEEFRTAPAFALAFLIIDRSRNGVSRVRDPSLPQVGASEESQIAADPHQEAAFYQFVDRIPNILHRPPIAAQIAQAGGEIALD